MSQSASCQHVIKSLPEPDWPSQDRYILRQLHGPACQLGIGFHDLSVGQKIHIRDDQERERLPAGQASDQLRKRTGILDAAGEDRIIDIQSTGNGRSLEKSLTYGDPKILPGHAAPLPRDNAHGCARGGSTRAALGGIPQVSGAAVSGLEPCLQSHDLSGLIADSDDAIRIQIGLELDGILSGASRFFVQVETWHVQKIVGLNASG